MILLAQMTSNNLENSSCTDNDHESHASNDTEDGTRNVCAVTAATSNLQQASDTDSLLFNRAGSISSGDSFSSHADKSAFTSSSVDTLSSTSQESTSCRSLTVDTTSLFAQAAALSGVRNTAEAPLIARRGARRVAKYLKNEHVSAPRGGYAAKQKNTHPTSVPAPLALVAAATNVALNATPSSSPALAVEPSSSQTTITAPLAVYDTPPDTPTTSTNAAAAEHDASTSASSRQPGGHKGRFRLPPPLKNLTKKHSCPHLFSSAGKTTTAYNNAASGGLRSPRTPVLAAARNCDWIRNDFGSASALHSQPTQGARRPFDEPGMVFRFDHLVSAASVNKSQSYHQTLYQSGADNVDMTASSSSLCSSAAVTAKPTTRHLLIKRSSAVHLCRLDQPRSVVSKLTGSKLLRRWETHTLELDAESIRSTTPTGFMETPISYALIVDIRVVPHFEGNDKYCLRIFTQDGSILLQTNHVYTQQQLLSSIQWRRCMFRFRRVFKSCTRPEVLLKEIKCMVEMTIESSLQDETISLEPVQLICGVLKQIFEGMLCRTLLDPVIICVSPLLETVPSVSEICPWFNRYCRESPRSRLVDDIFSNVALQTLKKNMDFGKFPSARSFVQNFLLAIIAQNNGVERVKIFVQRAHGPASVCPHPRVLPNLISACLAAIHSIFDPTVPPSPIGLAPSAESLSLSDLALNPVDVDTLLDDDDDVAFGAHHGTTPTEIMDRRWLFCYCVVFEAVSEFEDWRSSLSSIVQPLPFPEDAFCNDIFARAFHNVVQRIGADPRCEVHLGVLGVREGKEGFFHLYCPGGPSCVDNGELYANMLNNLLNCCCKRKQFLQSLNGMLGPLQLLALREKDGAIKALCYMLEMDVVEGDDMKVQIITTLQSTSDGRRYYLDLCDRQHALKELVGTQHNDGPRKMTLPSKSTDGDLAVLLSSGSFGNLEWLSLAFTNVTSACADYLIKLPSLRYLNLWSTQFGDTGVQLLAENLLKLQVLNLCETRVTDKGILTLSALKNLRKLNLNSTQLSAKTFQILQEKLPQLEEVDIRYTEAWCAEDYPSRTGPQQTGAQRTTAERPRPSR